MASVVSRAIIKARKDGLAELTHDAWYELYRTIRPYSPNFLQWLLAQLYWLPYGCIIKRKNEVWQRTGRRTTFSFLQLAHHKRSRVSFWKYVYEQYTYDGFVEVNQGDIVVDVGGLVGEFSILAAKSAKRVIIIEPNPRSAQCIRENMKPFNNVDVVEKAAWKEKTNIELNLSYDSSNDSLLTPDSDDKNKSVMVQADTLENILHDLGVESVDFLKIEAEGVEPEVMHGIDGLKVEKMAVNCDPERDGESPEQEVTNYLSQNGYLIQKDSIIYYNTIFAKKRNNN